MRQDIDTEKRDLEARRVLEENARRYQEVPSERYAAWQPAELFMRQGRERAAVRLLRRADVFPKIGDACFEIGYGRLGWLATLLGWGLRSEDLSGIELDDTRAEVARLALPGANLAVGDAVGMSSADESFRLVVASTVFTSILDQEVRIALAREMIRVLAPGGAVLWYDFRVNNPKNPHVRGISKGEIGRLFQGLEPHFSSVTLAPPIARRVVSLSWTMALILESLPFLRTHLLGVLIKPDRKEGTDSA